MEFDGNYMKHLLGPCYDQWQKQARGKRGLLPARGWDLVFDVTSGFSRDTYSQAPLSKIFNKFGEPVMPTNEGDPA